ncbi:MAG: trypsin-like peptidase domain-containing protein [Archangiaceae bacterium]|nr:trypsin-like peptidase domain-containing protein [Archangiaceae bacterium]
MTDMTRSALPLLSLLVPVLAFAQGQVPREVAMPSLAPLVESVKSAVVNVDVQKRESGGGEMDDEMLERFFGMRAPKGRGQLMQGMGSGFVIDPKGLVLTNNHVVDGALTTLRVRFDDGRTFDAEVVGRDPLVDVALIKIKAKVDNLPALKLGDSAAMRVGDWVVAIGNPFGLASSVSSGIISATERKIGAGPYDQFLQTDAAINPGNSGGPLFNLRGEVVGMNTAIYSNPQAPVGGNIGIGFAVPSNLIKALVPQLEKEGAVTRGWLGVGIQDLTPELAKAMGVPVSDGAVITAVNDGSPAKKAGMLEDDAVTAIDGEKVPNADAFRRVVALKRPDSVVALSTFRNGKPVEVKVKLGTRPDLERVGQREPKGSARAAEDAKPSRLGLSFQDMDPRLSERTGLPTSGALIVEVAPGSVSERAGLRRGMVVIEANHHRVSGRDDLVRAISDAKAGQVLLLRVTAPGGEGRSLRALEIP